MLPRTIFLSRLIGLYCLIVGISEVTHRGTMVEIATAFVHDPGLLFLSGLFALLAGIAMVLGHNIWTGGAAPVVVTVLGWYVLIKGVGVMFISPASMAALIAAAQYPDYFYLYAAIPVLLGLYLTYSGFSTRLPATQP